MDDFDPDWLGKLEALRSRGIDPYPNGFVVTHTAQELADAFGELEDPSTAPDATEVRLGGRVIFRNRMGKAMFLRVQDRSGRMQIYLRREQVGEDTFETLKKLDST